MKRLYVFMVLAIVVICISLFFIDFKEPPEKVKGATIEKEKEKPLETISVNTEVKAAVVEESAPEVKPLSAQKYVFKKYDHLANAQAFISFLKKKNIGFEVGLEGEKDQGGVSIYFEFNDKKNKLDKLQVLTKTTGTDYMTGGAVQ